MSRRNKSLYLDDRDCPEFIKRKELEMNHRETPGVIIDRLHTALAETSQMMDSLRTEAEALRNQLVSKNEKLWTDQDLYDAYLLGCEDDCLPEPLRMETFLASWGDKAATAHQSKEGK